MSDLKVTKSVFNVVGIVNRMNEKAMREGVTNGSNREYRSIRFGVKTSPTNEVFVSLFGMEPESVYFWSKKEGTKKVAYDPNGKFYSQRPEGMSLIGVKCGVEETPEGKTNNRTLVDYDAVKHIYDNLSDGDVVKISGEIRFSTYEKDGVSRLQKELVIRSIYKQDKPLDFTAEDFTEIASFGQDIVIVDVDTSEAKETKKVYVIGRTIRKTGKDDDGNEKFDWIDGQFVVDGESQPKMVKAFMKQKFGTWMHVEGLILNRLEVTEVDVEEEEEDEWGNRRPAGMGAGRTVTSELRITYVDVDSIEEKAFKEDDFIKSEEASFGSKKNESKKKKEFGEDETDDDLPWR